MLGMAALVGLTGIWLRGVVDWHHRIVDYISGYVSRAWEAVANLDDLMGIATVSYSEYERCS